MDDKPKIAHFTLDDSSEPTPTGGSASDRSKLTNLYPAPKTYGQRKQDKKLRQESERRHWPERPHITIAAYGSAVMGLLLWFAQNVYAWWFRHGDPALAMSAVFFSFTFGLVLMILLVAWVVYVNRQFSYFGGPAGKFWLIYAVSITAVLILWTSGWVLGHADILWILGLSGLHFVLLSQSVRRVMGRRSET